ncbi:ORF12L [orange spotted grouper iridovirus]|uniref:ORF12L n=1 Tax=orange spotted grouper iridovirus TaxID=2848011 RepID=Q4KSE5_ISKNV|nr:ORF12L [Orange-spotted grouper iridovirus]
MSGILTSLAGAVLCAACYRHIDKLVAGVRIVTAMTIVILPTWAKRLLAHLSWPHDCECTTVFRQPYTH